jgi:hypothetical protein
MSSTSGDIEEYINDKHAYDLNNLIKSRYDFSSNDIIFEISDMVDPIRLAAVGDHFPYHMSTEGIVLYKRRNTNNSFLFLHWTVLSPPSLQEGKEGESLTKSSLQQPWLAGDLRNRLVSCTEEEAFDFLYSLYGSNRNSDVTDEEIDQILKVYFPNKFISK